MQNLIKTDKELIARCLIIIMAVAAMMSKGVIYIALFIPLLFHFLRCNDGGNNSTSQEIEAKIHLRNLSQLIIDITT